MCQGLPGADTIDVDRCLHTIDDWARSCRHFTDSVMPRFRRGECDYPYCEPKFRIQALITHLQRDLGVRYHPERKSANAVFQPEDSFVHGIIQGEGGTCGNLPILYAAVGRRLGYPLRLALTRCHQYCRWEAPTRAESFNIEAAGDGVSFFEDAHYRTGKFKMPRKSVEVCG